MRIRTLGVVLLLSAPAIVAASQSWKNTAPESFQANAQILEAFRAYSLMVTFSIFTSDTGRSPALVFEVAISLTTSWPSVTRPKIV